MKYIFMKNYLNNKEKMKIFKKTQIYVRLTESEAVDLTATCQELLDKKDCRENFRNKPKSLKTIISRITKLLILLLISLSCQAQVKFTSHVTEILTGKIIIQDVHFNYGNGLLIIEKDTIKLTGYSYKETLVAGLFENTKKCSEFYNNFSIEIESDCKGNIRVIRLNGTSYHK